MHEPDTNHSSYEQERHGLCNLKDRHRKVPTPALCEEALGGIGGHSIDIIVLACATRAARLAAIFRENFTDYTDGIPGNIKASGPA